MEEEQIIAKYEEFVALDLYKNLAENFDSMDETTAVKTLQSLLQLFNTPNFVFSSLFEDYHIMENLLKYNTPATPNQIRFLIFECIQKLIDIPQFDKIDFGMIIDSLAPNFEHFEDELVFKVFDIFSYLSKKSQDNQQYILKTLYYDKIIESIHTEYSDPNILNSAFLFVASLFEYATSDLFANKVSNSLLDIPPSPFRSFVITKIANVMPKSLAVIGYDNVFQSVMDQISTGNSDIIKSALETLISIIKDQKDNTIFDFSPVFALLSHNEDIIRINTLIVLSTLVECTNGGIEYLFNNNIYDAVVDNIEKIISQRERTECARFIGSCIIKMPSQIIIEKLNPTIIELLVFSIQIDSASIQQTVIEALDKAVMTHDDQILTDVREFIEDQDMMETIIELMSSDNLELSKISTIFYNDFAEIELPDDDLDEIE